MDRDKDAKLTFDEFVEGSKQDPTIVQVCTFEVTGTIHAKSATPIGPITIRRPGIALSLVGILVLVTGESSHFRTQLATDYNSITLCISLFIYFSC
jgi:hypothetical protein